MKDLRSPWPWVLSLVALLTGGVSAIAEQGATGNSTCVRGGAPAECGWSRGQIQAREAEIIEQANGRFRALVLDHLANAVQQPPNGPLFNGDAARTGRYCLGILSALQSKNFTLFPKPQAKSSQAGLQKTWASQLVADPACEPQRRAAERIAADSKRSVWLYTSAHGVAGLGFDLGAGSLNAWAQLRSCTSPSVSFGPALKAGSEQALLGDFEGLAYAVINIADDLHLAIGGVLWMGGNNLVWRHQPFLNLRAGRMEQLANEGIDWPEDGSGAEPTKEQKNLMKGRVLAVYPLDVPWLPGSPKAETRDGTAYGPCLWNLED